jgi:diacylglycerol kinase (ATP)
MSVPAKSTKAAVDDHSQRVHADTKEGFIGSTMHAFHGVKHVFEHERNARIHLMVAIIALLVGVWLQISDAELAAVFFAVIIVFLAEIFNTAIERTLDLIDLKENPRIKLIKDMAAGAVLVAAAAAVAIGFAIFAPHIARYVWGA